MLLAVSRVRLTLGTLLPGPRHRYYFCVAPRKSKSLHLTPPHIYYRNIRIIVRFWMPKNKVALVRGKAAELNAPLLSGYLEPGKQPYSFSRDSKRKSFHVIKKPSRGYNGLSCLGIRVVSLTVCVCVSGLLACCSFPILLWIKREASLSPRLLGLLMVLQDNKCSIELINHDRDPARSLYLFSQSFSTANTCFLACKSTCVLACSCHTRTTQSLKSGTATVCFF